MILSEITFNSIWYLFRFSFSSAISLSLARISRLICDFLTWICSIIVSNFWIWAFVDALLFSISMIWFFFSSTDPVICAIFACNSVSSFLIWSSSDCFSSICFTMESFSVWSSFICPSRTSISESITLARCSKCSSFIRALWICSFNSAIWFSNCCFRIVVSFNWRLAFSTEASITSTCSSIASYSVFVSAYCLVASSSSPFVIRSFSSSPRIWSRIRSISSRNMLISYVFNSSFRFRYSLAFSDWRSNGPTCFSSSDRISLTRTRFWRSSSNFLTDILFLRLNLTIPAASSKSSRLSSGLPLKILSICPCPIIEYPSFPIPVS